MSLFFLLLSLFSLYPIIDGDCKAKRTAFLLAQLPFGCALAPRSGGSGSLAELVGPLVQFSHKFWLESQFTRMVSPEGRRSGGEQVAVITR